MSVCDMNDVTAIWFRSLSDERVRIQVAPKSLTRKQASDLLFTITSGIEQRTNDCGFTTEDGGECRMWW